MRVRGAAVIACGVAVLAGCGGSALTVQGTISDPVITSAADCDGNGTIGVMLTNAAGSVIARDPAPFAWSGGSCRVSFTFSDVPRLAGYGIRVTGFGTRWLTPAQAAQPVRITFG